MANVQQWARKTKHGTEAIMVELRSYTIRDQANMPVTMATVHRAYHLTLGWMANSAPMVMDIEAAIKAGAVKSKDFGFELVEIDPERTLEKEVERRR